MLFKVPQVSIYGAIGLFGFWSLPVANSVKDADNFTSVDAGTVMHAVWTMGSAKGLILSISFFISMFMDSAWSC